MKLRNQQGITTFWGISIIIIESIVVFFIFYILYFFWIENPMPTSKILIIRAFSKKEITIPKQVETTGWFKYSSQVYGFTFQYPEGYQIAEDTITYGDSSGQMIDLEKDGDSFFSLRIFKIQAEETMAEAFERLTGVNPTIYQSFTEKVDNREAIVYRQQPGEAAGDHIYFINDNYLYESAFDAFSSQILATFQFTD